MDGFLRSEYSYCYIKLLPVSVRYGHFLAIVCAREHTIARFEYPTNETYLHDDMLSFVALFAVAVCRNGKFFSSMNGSSVLPSFLPSLIGSLQQ